MRLTAQEVERKLRLVWGTRAVVVPYRICGNRYVYAARDYRGHWLALDASWVAGRQVEPSDGAWPESRQNAATGWLVQTPDCPGTGEEGGGDLEDRKRGRW